MALLLSPLGDSKRQGDDGSSLRVGYLSVELQLGL